MHALPANKIRPSVVLRLAIGMAGLLAVVAVAPMLTYRIEARHQAIAAASPPPVRFETLMQNLPAVEGQVYSVCGVLTMGFEKGRYLWSGHSRTINTSNGPVGAPESTIAVDVDTATEAPEYFRDFAGRTEINAWVVVTGRFYSNGDFHRPGGHPFLLQANSVTPASEDCLNGGV